MKRNKEKRRILKIRPFNMANFSGGSGYLVFSIIYQAMAVLPAICLYFIVRFCHKQIIERNMGIAPMIALSVFLTAIALLGIMAICGLLIDPILTEIADR